MDTVLFYELVGYTGSLLVALSLTMKSLQRLRIINMIGATFFIAYGLLIGALPIALLNGLTLGVNAYNLWRMLQQKDYFTLMEIRPDSAYLRRFLDFYHKEISELIPTYLFKPSEDQTVIFILRNMVPAGLAIVKPTGETAQIFLDFVIPGYRDFRAGKFLFDESADYFWQKGIKQLVSAPGSPRHESYLKRMGFEMEEGKYQRRIQPKVLRDGAM
ncbi:MAG: YgjV family protein [Anaerolineales bacterium]|nr:YgjV family protein [Anaerolineales bacterium]